MKEDVIKNRIKTLLEMNGNESKNGQEVFHGTRNILMILYGANSSQLEIFTKAAQNELKMRHHAARLIHGVLNNALAEIDAGLINDLQKTVTGEVLTDFLLSARAALDKKGDDAKNVAACFQPRWMKIQFAELRPPTELLTLKNSIVFYKN